jgi:tetratricopeptide (TPR) repeat protein
LKRRWATGGERAGRTGTLGAYQSQVDFSKGIEYHTQDLAIAKEVGDRAGEGRAYGNLCNAYQSQGDFIKTIEYHTQHLAIAKEVGDRRGDGRAYASLDIEYQSHGDISKAIEYHTQALAIAKEVGDRAGECRAYGRTLGVRMMKSARPSSTTRRPWRLQRKWATGRGRAGRTGTLDARISSRGTSARASSTTSRTWRLQRRPQAGPGDCKGDLFAIARSCLWYSMPLLKSPCD